MLLHLDFASKRPSGITNEKIGITKGPSEKFVTIVLFLKSLEPVLGSIVVPMKVSTPPNRFETLNLCVVMKHFLMNSSDISS